MNTPDQFTLVGEADIIAAGGLSISRMLIAVRERDRIGKRIGKSTHE
jgi:hypothetical protein